MRLYLIQDKETKRIEGVYAKGLFTDKEEFLCHVSVLAEDKKEYQVPSLTVEDVRYEYLKIKENEDGTIEGVSNRSIYSSKEREEGSFAATSVYW